MSHFGKYWPLWNLGFFYADIFEDYKKKNYGFIQPFFSWKNVPFGINCTPITSFGSRYGLWHLCMSLNCFFPCFLGKLHFHKSQPKTLRAWISWQHVGMKMEQAVQLFKIRITWTWVLETIKSILIQSIDEMCGNYAGILRTYAGNPRDC